MLGTETLSEKRLPSRHALSLSLLSSQLGSQTDVPVSEASHISFFLSFLAHVSSEAPLCLLREIRRTWMTTRRSAAASMALAFRALDPRCFTFRGCLELNLWKMEPETCHYRDRKPPKVTTCGCISVMGALLGPPCSLHCPHSQETTLNTFPGHAPFRFHSSQSPSFLYHHPSLIRFPYQAPQRV